MDSDAFARKKWLNVSGCDGSWTMEQKEKKARESDAVKVDEAVLGNAAFGWEHEKVARVRVR